MNQELFNGLYIRVDWLEFTFTEFSCYSSIHDKFNFIFSNIGMDMELFNEVGKGGIGYKRSLKHIHENICIYFDGTEDMGIHIRCSGTAVSYMLNQYKEKFVCDTPFGKGYEFPFDDVSLLLSSFLSCVLKYGHFTRIDLAIDDVGASFFTVNDVFNLVDNNQVSSRFRKWQNLKSASFTEGCIGHTIYFGSRESDVFLRVYEKSYEQKIDSFNWTRWEFEIKHGKSDVLARELSTGTSIATAALGLLNNYIRFIKRDSTNVSMCSALPLWESFINGVSKLRLTLAPEQKTIEDKKRWIQKQCMPTIAGLVVATGGDISFLRDNLETHFERLKEKDKKLFTDSLLKGGVNDDVY